MADDDALADVLPFVRTDALTEPAALLEPREPEILPGPRTLAEVFPETLRPRLRVLRDDDTT